MPTIRIDDDVWSYLQSKAKPFEDSPNDVLRREFNLGTSENPRGVRPQETTSAKSSAPFDSMGGKAPENLNGSRGRQQMDDLKPDKDYTYHRVSGYRLDGTHYTARSFKDILVGMSDILRSANRGKFDEAAMALRGRTRIYYSRSPERLKFPEEISGKGLFVETNLNANLIVGICRRLLENLGRGSHKFQVE
jgi:negative regulator of replication initiation